MSIGLIVGGLSPAADGNLVAAGETGAAAGRLVRREQGAQGFRSISSEGGFDLNTLGEQRTITLPRCLAATISIGIAAGTWAGAEVALKRAIPGGTVDFGSAKALSGPGAVVLSESEALGTSEVVVVVTAANGAYGQGVITVTIEESH